MTIVLALGLIFGNQNKRSKLIQLQFNTTTTKNTIMALFDYYNNNMKQQFEKFTNNIKLFFIETEMLFMNTTLNPIKGTMTGEW